MIYYASHTLNDSQMNYNVIEKEFLARVFAFEKFKPWFSCHCFHLSCYTWAPSFKEGF